MPGNYCKGQRRGESVIPLPSWTLGPSYVMYVVPTLGSVMELTAVL